MNAQISDINEYTSIDVVNQIIKRVLNRILLGLVNDTDFFLHPLGFYYCRLISNNQHQLRLHFWSHDYKLKEDLFIHDHYYDLCSWVLNGKIINYTYQVDLSEEKTEYALFKSSYLFDQNVRTITKTPDYRMVSLKEVSEIERGSKYFILRDTFHSNKVIVDKNKIGLTCVYTFNHKDDISPKVVGLTANDEYIETLPQKLGIQRIKEICSIALKSI